MSSKKGSILDLEFHPVTSSRWRDLVDLFGKRGACGGCWCMFWRLARAEWQQQLGEKNRKALKKLIDSGEIPGILAYAEGKPVGWCSLAPRERFVRLENSRVLKIVDDNPVWSVVCFFVDKKFRRKGTTVELLKAAIEFASNKKAKIVEGYPVEPKKGKMPDVFAYTGLASAFRQAGFKEILRRSETRPIMRCFIK